jgi:hypothetical protein
LLRAKKQDGKSALNVATSPQIKAPTYSFLVSQLLPVLLHSYMDTYLTLHIMNELKNHVHHDDINTIHLKRKGRPKLKFDYLRFLKDYKSLRKLKARVRDESKKVPASEIIGKFLFLLE